MRISAAAAAAPTCGMSRTVMVCLVLVPDEANAASSMRPVRPFVAVTPSSVPEPMYESSMLPIPNSDWMNDCATRAERTCACFT